MRMHNHISVLVTALAGVMIASGCKSQLDASTGEPGGESPHCTNGSSPASMPASMPAADGERGEQENADMDTAADASAPGGYSEAEFARLHEMKAKDNTPLRGTMIDLQGSKAYLSLPEGVASPMPAVLVIHEWWGLNDNVKLWADRLANEGYAALAVDLYGGKVAATPDEAGALMKSVDKKRAAKTLKKAYAFLGQDKRIKAKKRGVIGWCFGGGWSLQVALTEPSLTSSVVYYGELVNDPKKLKTIKAPLLGIFANQDKWITPALVDEFEKALEKAHVTHKILRFDADHAFGNPSNKERYDRSAAEAAWQETQAFLEQTLKN
ncbi:MAG: dienelactone hydrolase family protein [Deltaproteobacteria bacterium]|nr:dienelactone hydrolase family protein [Deltaproteobacteria bacterium]